jgi:hypothetical protein
MEEQHLPTYKAYGRIRKINNRITPMKELYPLHDEYTQSKQNPYQQNRE